MYDYILTNEFDRDSIITYFNNQIKGCNFWTKLYNNKNLEKKVENRFKSCPTKIRDYNAFNHYINESQSGTKNLNCDMIVPPLSTLKGVSKKCRKIQDYFLQFGLRAYLQFILLLQREIDEDLKVVPEGLFSTYHKFQLRQFYNDVIFEITQVWHDNVVRLVIEVEYKIKTFYKSYCYRLMEHYNRFNTFFEFNFIRAENHKLDPSTKTALEEKYKDVDRTIEGDVSAGDCEFFERFRN